MPYVLQVTVAQVENWRGQPSFSDVYLHNFDVCCEYLARNGCFDRADSKNLIGNYLVATCKTPVNGISSGNGADLDAPR